MFTAIFVGGEFDLTKMVVKDDIGIVHFASMSYLPEPFLENEMRPVTISTHILDYRLCGRTKKGVLIYEFENKKVK